MSKWKDGRLDLGRLGTLTVHSGFDEEWVDKEGNEAPRWHWMWFPRPNFVGHCDHRHYRTEAAAQRAAIRWLRAALKQAGKKIGA